MVGPFDSVVRLDVEGYAVERLDVLDVRRVAANDPRVDGEDLLVGLDAVDELVRGEREIGDIEMGLHAVESPDDAVLLDRGEPEQGRAWRRGVAAARLYAHALGVEIPVVEWAAEVLADHAARAEIGAQVRAIRA